MKCLMDHIVLNVEDDEKMISFYSKVLMMPSERLEEYHAGTVPFPSVRMNADTIIDLFPKKMWQKTSQATQGRANLNHFCIALSKRTWEKLFEQLQANKLTIEEGPVSRWGAQGREPRSIFGTRRGTLSRRGIMKATIVQGSVSLGLLKRRPSLMRGEIARSVKGVRDVKNNLLVK